MAEPAQPSPTEPAPPRAPAPKGWRWVRPKERKERTLHNDFPTVGAKIRFFIGTGLQLLAIGLGLLSFAAIGFVVFFTDNELGWTFALIGAGLFFLAVTVMIAPLIPSPSRKARKARRKPAEGQQS